MMDHLRDTGRIDVARAARWGAIAVLSALLLLSCEPPSYTTIEWEPDGDGFVQYSTNDPHNYGTIHYLPLANAEDPMDTVTATVKKVSGSSVVGFGVVFCYQDEDNHYRLLITTDGHYQVGKMLGGMFSEKVPWAYSAELNTGMGETNEISIIQGPNGTFTVWFNAVEIPPAFSDTPFFWKGSAGPCIGIGSSGDESFPGVPEDARFQMLAPVVYP